ncbi:winged helix-turn-helix domain-containing protein [Nocardia sp. CDC159]|uniref:Winged helix-turn-helix domain-containing protein n=1 Tax=Nocardia pulmonis TaxID=2951408 RepID=A0A9X2EE06_9NOCA|nr:MULTISPECIES: ArsR family transcriptional regulator [Nocardia]MCM6776518.1 winged helix-turn-helix domain-containing protein [Nocardia pulmonis]MCM6788942.1 winged helix-turn-helix domain-containing protein [Nocardia sp. CDC159]
MLRIHCTADDLLRVSIAEQPLPLTELAIAVAMLQRRDSHPIFAPWRRQLSRTLPMRARPLLQLISPLGTGPDFLEPPTPNVDEGIDMVMSTPREVVSAQVRRMCSIDREQTPWVRLLAEQDREAWSDLEHALRAGYSTVLARHWPRLRSAFNAETAWRSRILARHGLRAALTSTDTSIRWNGTTLEAESPHELTVTTTGQGITLYPSLLWADHPLVAFLPTGRLLLVYPSTTPLPLVDGEGDPPDSIAALLGVTRARALQSVIHERTTSELASELGLTVGAASMQAKALREAGLITSQRDGKAVWHQCTPLGMDLLSANRR